MHFPARLTYAFPGARRYVQFAVFQPVSPTAAYTVTPLLSTLDARVAPTVVASTLATQVRRSRAV